MICMYVTSIRVIAGGPPCALRDSGLTEARSRSELTDQKRSLLIILKDWQLKAIQVVWNSPEGANSGTVCVEVKKLLNGGSISRASIINFLNKMKELSVSDDDERTGKGGVTWFTRWK
jgi:hypothetical protein